MSVYWTNIYFVRAVFDATINMSHTPRQDHECSLRLTHKSSDSLRAHSNSHRPERTWTYEITHLGSLRLIRSQTPITTHFNSQLIIGSLTHFDSLIQLAIHLPSSILGDGNKSFLPSAVSKWRVKYKAYTTLANMRIMIWAWTHDSHHNLNVSLDHGLDSQLIPWPQP